MNTLTPAQKKIFMIAAAGLAGFVVLWLVFYRPVAREVRTAQTELEEMTARIQEIESFVDKNNSVDDQVLLFQKQYEAINARFPSDEKETIRFLSETARLSDLTVVSVQSFPKAEFHDEDGKGVQIDAKKCYTAQVSMEFKGAYRSVVDYLEKLKDGMPAYFTVQSLRMNKGAVRDELNVVLGVTLYLLP